MPPEFSPGQPLPSLKKHITQEKINLYAEASGDFNPIHVDESFAAKTPLGGTIAHGMLILAYISEMMTQAFGESWLSRGEISVRFKAPARTRDILTISGCVDSIEEVNGVSYTNCTVQCHNQRDEAVVAGQAVVKLAVRES
jgi:3-hydroxybutyryl-CoA dehydratase